MTGFDTDLVRTARGMFERVLTRDELTLGLFLSVLWWEAARASVPPEISVVSVEVLSDGAMFHYAVDEISEAAWAAAEDIECMLDVSLDTSLDVGRTFWIGPVADDTDWPGYSHRMLYS